MIQKNEEIRDKVLHNQSLQDMAKKMKKFMEANKEFRLLFVVKRQKYFHLFNSCTLEKYYLRPTDTEVIYFPCANYCTMQCKSIIKIDLNAHFFELSKNDSSDLKHNLAC